MALYLFYTIEGNEAGRAPLENLDLRDDEAAVEKAIELLDRHPIEVWEHGDLVARLDPWLSGPPPYQEHALPASN